MNRKQKREEGSIYHWSWGAFGFRWIWGLFFGVYWPLYYKVGYIISMIIILPLFLKDNQPTESFFAIAAIYTGFDLLISIYLGIVGRRQAWWSSRKQWRNRDHFLKLERKWTRAFFIALILLLLSIGITIGQFMVEFVESGSFPSEIRSLPNNVL